MRLCGRNLMRQKMLDLTDGSCCFMCANFIGDAVGYPRTCGDCENKPKKYPKPWSREFGSNANDKPFACECGKRFTTESGMYTHMQNKHGVTR